MNRAVLYIAVVLLTFSVAGNAATFRFDTDPFAGSTALTTPGRQIVGGEPFITFDIAADTYLLDENVFGVNSSDLFANDEIGNLPTGGVNIVVLRTFDNDNDPATAFGAGTAASLIANQITTPGAGFFIYFNSGLDLPRLVYSTNLDDPTADLKIIARMTNLGGQAGRDQMVNFAASNFVIAAVPEPSTGLLMSAAGALWACGYVLRKRRTQG